MKLPISYEEAQKQYPTEVAACVASVRKGKSKDKNTDPSTWRWFFSWGESIEAVSFGSLIRSAAMARHKPAANPTPEEKLAAVLPNILGMSLDGVPPNKRTQGVASLTKGVVPAEVQAYLLNIYKEEAAEKARVDSLTPEQKEAEMNAALAELRKGGGFMELRIR